jgi:hypothetical protein
MNSEDKIVALIKKDMKGKGTIKDWIIKHKKALAVAGGVLAAMLGTIGAAAAYRSRNDFTPAEEQLAREIGLYDPLPPPASPRTPEGSPPSTPSGMRHSRAFYPEEKTESIDILSKPFPARRRLSIRGRRSMGNGSSKSCCCGRCSDQIMEQLGGYQVAQNYLVKYPKVGEGLIDDLIHKGITKGFNFVGNIGLNLLIETIVKIVGEPSRKVVNKLVKKYGWKSISLIKKYAHKGINYVTKKVEENFGGNLCPKCNDFLDNEFRCGNIDSLEKMGSGWTDDLATGLTWFGKNVIAPTARILPGSLGEALAYGPANLDKIGELGSDWQYKDPFEDEKELATYQGARSKAPKNKKGLGFKKPEPKYQKDTIATLISLFPSRLIGTMVGETLPIKRGDTSILPARFRPREGEGKKSKLVKFGKTFEKILSYIPIDLLKELFFEIVKKPDSVSILPKRFLHDQDEISIWGDGRSGGTKMLAKPKYTDEEKEMMILPIDEPEPEMRIQPFPYPVQHGRPQDAFLKPYGPYGRLPNMEMMEKMKKRTKNLINPLSDPKKFDEIVKNNGGKKKRKGRGKMMEGEELLTNLSLVDSAPDHLSYSGSGDYKNLQDPNFNTNKLIVGKSDNKDYKSFESGMKHKAQGKIIIGGKKRTKKQIKKKLRFNL